MRRAIIVQLPHLACAAALVVVAACDGGGATPPSEPSPVPAGRYLLQRVDDRAVPAEVPPPLAGLPTVTVHADTLHVAADGTFTWHTRTDMELVGGPLRVTDTGRFRYTTDGATLVYFDRPWPTPANVPIGEAQLLGTALRFVVLPPWPSGGISQIDFARLP